MPIPFAFLLAGHETSAAMLTWTLLELCRSPDLAQQVQHASRLAFPSMLPVCLLDP